MEKQRLYSRHVIDGPLNEDRIIEEVTNGLSAVRSLNRPIDWETLNITLGRDDLFPLPAITITALEA